MRSITTSTMFLQPIQAEHAELVYPDLSDALVYQYLDETEPRSLDELRSKFARWQSLNQSETSLLTWMFAPLDGSPVGYVQARLMAAENSATISYVLSARHRGRGYALSAVEAVIDHLRIENGTHRFLAVVHPRNTPAVKLLKHLAFIRMSNSAASGFGSKTPGNLLFVL